MGHAASGSPAWSEAIRISSNENPLVRKAAIDAILGSFPRPTVIRSQQRSTRLEILLGS